MINLLLLKKIIKTAVVTLMVAAVLAIVVLFVLSYSKKAPPEVPVATTDQPNTKPAGETNANQIKLPPLVTPPKTGLTLIAVGDIMLSRNVGAKMVAHQDYKYPFLETAEFTASADLTIGNLETAITPGRPIQTGEMMFRADPEAVSGLTYAGFDILSLANNHTPNFGDIGLKNTFKYLHAAGIDYMGAGENYQASRQPVIKKVNGVTIAFLAYNDSDVVPVDYQATATDPGTVFLDTTIITEDVKRAKKLVDLVIVTMHSGSEYQPLPNSRQKEYAHAAIDAGADLVIGHHPHVVQTVEKYQGKWIIYSLGNFVFDQMWSQATREGVIAEIRLDKTGVTDIEYYPVIIEDYCQPRMAEGEEGERILGRLGEYK